MIDVSCENIWILSTGFPHAAQTAIFIVEIDFFLHLFTSFKLLIIFNKLTCPLNLLFN